MQTRKAIQIVVAGLLLICAGRAQGVISLEQHFDALVHPGPAVAVASASPEDLERATKQAGRADLSGAVPLMFTALASSDRSVFMEGSMALIGVSLRSDSADVLGPYVGKLYALLGRGGEYSAFALAILDGLRPAPPPQATSQVLAFLQRTDQDTNVQTGAVGFLLKHNPADQQVLESVARFGSRPLGVDSRLRLLDVVTLLFKGNEKLLPLLGGSMHDPAVGVRERSISDLTRLGRRVLDGYATDLRKVALDPNEAPEVRTAADRAIAVWAGSVDPNRP